jgi:hypothetical protein
MGLVCETLERWPRSRLIRGNHDAYFLDVMTADELDQASFDRWFCAWGFRDHGVLRSPLRREPWRPDFGIRLLVLLRFWRSGAAVANRLPAVDCVSRSCSVVPKGNLTARLRGGTRPAIISTEASD